MLFFSNIILLNYSILDSRIKAGIITFLEVNLLSKIFILFILICFTYEKLTKEIFSIFSI